VRILTIPFATPEFCNREPLHAKDQAIPERGFDPFDIDLPDFNERLLHPDIENARELERLPERRHRAIQEAVKLGRKYGWDDDGIYVLAEIFEVYGWNSAKHSLNRLLTAGLEPAELKLASDIRYEWRSIRRYAASSGRYLHEALGWPTALDLVRSFRGYPDIEEVGQFLWEACDDWETSPCLYAEYVSFEDYLKARVMTVDKELMISPHKSLASGYHWHDENEEYMHCGHNSLEKQLTELGLPE
jgi:hypothetical protein